jgi:hypothetical protein
MRAVELLEKRRFIDVERRQRIANRYRLTDSRTWPGTRTIHLAASEKKRSTGGVVQPCDGGAVRPPPGGVTRPDGRVVPPEEARQLLQKLAKLVGVHHRLGGVARPEQEIRTSEQERSAETKRVQPEAQPQAVHRSREEQLAYVAAMMKRE